MHKKLLAIGNAYVDEIFFGLHFPDDSVPTEREFVASEREFAPGGSALNYVRLCSYLGMETEFVGKIGDDEMGKLLVRLTKEAGIEPAFIVDETVQTNVSIRMVNQSTKALMMWSGSANQALTANEVIKRVEPILAGLEYLYLGGCFKLPQLLPAFVRLRHDARASHVKLIIDHNRVPHNVSAEVAEAIRELVLASDFYLPSRDEFCELWNVDGIEAGLEKVGKLTNSRVVVKDAERGAVALQNGRLLRVPAFPVRAINPVGAGDSFNAGFIAGITKSWGLQESVRLGCAVAALKISRQNPPTFAEAEQLASHAASEKLTA